MEIILQTHKNFLYCNEKKSERKQNENDVKKKKNGKM